MSYFHKFLVCFMLRVLCLPSLYDSAAYCLVFCWCHNYAVVRGEVINDVCLCYHRYIVIVIVCEWHVLSLLCVHATASLPCLRSNLLRQMFVEDVDCSQVWYWEGSPRVWCVLWETQQVCSHWSLQYISCVECVLFSNVWHWFTSDMLVSASFFSSC